VTIEIADGSDCLDHDLKFTGCSFQRNYLQYRTKAGLLGPEWTLLKKSVDVTPREPNRQERC